MQKFQFISLIFFGLLFAAVPVADEVDHIYGKGVHAFFDQNYGEAVAILSQADELRSNDPRTYYFMGLAYLRQKKNELADQSFKKAAVLEFSGRSIRDYSVSESLRRIQGTERLHIEQIRSEERINAQKREQQIREARYGADNAVSREALRRSVALDQNEDLSTILKNMADDLGDNTFVLKPLNPVVSPEEKDKGAAVSDDNILSVLARELGRGLGAWFTRKTENDD